MPEFAITAPDGRTFKVSGPTSDGARQALQQYLGGNGGMAGNSGMQAHQPAVAAPIEVELPDGTVAEFPSGTSNDVMKGAIQRLFPAGATQTSEQRTSDPAQSGGVTPDLRDKARTELYRRKAQAELYHRRNAAAATGYPRGATIEQQRAIAIARARMLQAQEKKQQTQQQNEGMAGTLDAFGRGMTNAATLGFADEIGAGARWLGGKMLPWQSNVTYDQALQEVRSSDQATANAHPVADIAGQVTGTVGQAAALGRAGLSAAGNAIDRGAKLGAVARGSALDGAVLGGLAGAGHGEGGLQDRAANAGYGALGGGLIGGAIPYGMAAAGKAGKRVLSPFLSNPERERAVQTLANEGVKLTAGQRTGSTGLRYAESELGGRVGSDMMEQQGEQFTAAALKRAGISANRATPEVIDDGFRTIGDKFDSLAARNSLEADGQLAQDLGSTVREYFSLVPESARAPVVMDTVRDVAEAMKRGPLDGSAYQAARSRLDRAARSSASDPQLQSALHGLRNALDDGMERSIARTNPGDAGAWKDARSRYRNMLVIEKAITGAGEETAQGIVKPAKLRGATVQKQGLRNYARGRGDFNELARAGEATMKPLPNSGTAGRLNAQSLGTGLAGIVGGGAGYASGGDPATMAAGAAAGFLAPRVAGRMLMSRPVQGYLGNQLGQAAEMSPATRKILNLILNLEGSDDASSVGRSLLAR